IQHLYGRSPLGPSRGGRIDPIRCTIRCTRPAHRCTIRCTNSRPFLSSCVIIRHEETEKCRVVSPFGATKNPRFPGVLLQTGDLGFEPRLSDPESLVLPLHQSPSERWAWLDRP